MAIPPIVSTDQLAELLARTPDLVLLDARPDPEAYRKGHLRGAVHAHPNAHLSTATEQDFDPRRGGRHPLPSVEQWTHLLGSWGIDPDTTVVVYDAEDGSNAASRAWWMLRAVSHENVAVLDGGFRAAVDAGFETTTEVPSRQAKSPYPASKWLLPTVDVRAVDALREDPNWKVLDVRAAPRYRGETEPIDPIAGHIPGAVNLPFSENMEGGRFKSPEALRAQYEALLAGTPVDRLIVHCGSGVTACHTLLALESAGLRGARLYVGSWSEWCRNELPRNP